MKPGDIVRATKWITRRDGKCNLAPGKTAKVIRSHNQIVAIELEDGNQMIDIVCRDGIPLELIDSKGIVPLQKEVDD